MNQRTQTGNALEQLEQKIARWERSRSRGLAIRVAVRATDLTVDLLHMEEDAAWDLLIARARRTAAVMQGSEAMPASSQAAARMPHVAVYAPRQ